MVNLTCSPKNGPVWIRKFGTSRQGQGGGFSMKASKFTESQIAFVLKQGDEGTVVAEICRKAGISQATYSN